MSGSVGSAPEGTRAAVDAAPALEVRTTPLGGSALARAALAGAVPRDWYPPLPAHVDEWRLHVDAVRRQFAAGAWLELLRPAFDARGAAAERLERSTGGEGVVVTTGQQPGLFGGPLYTLSKALSARALADVLEVATGVPVAPVFWAATDDVDFAEASVAAISHGAQVDVLRHDGTAAEGTPMSAVPLGDDVPALLDRFVRAAGSAAYAPALDALRAAYAPGATVGGAYLALLRELLEPLGIAVLDASHPSVREAGFQLLRRTLMQSATLETALAERSAAIEAAGLTPQVADVAGRSLVFLYDGEGRKARVPVAEARGMATKVGRDALGPNVLLRPVMERFILPTVAYAAGPGEYAYFAQVSAVAGALGVSQPMAVPRWSGEIVEPHVRRALDRLGVGPEALHDAAGLEARLARAAMPADAAGALGTLRAAIAGAESALRGSVDRVVDDVVIAGATRRLVHHVERLERRYVAALKRRDDATTRDLAAARAALAPEGGRQERTLAWVPFLARHGTALVGAMLDEARAHAARLLDGTWRSR